MSPAEPAEPVIWDTLGTLGDTLVVLVALGATLGALGVSFETNGATLDTPRCVGKTLCWRFGFGNQWDALGILRNILGVWGWALARAAIMFENNYLSTLICAATHDTTWGAWGPFVC